MMITKHLSCKMMKTKGLILLAVLLLCAFLAAPAAASGYETAGEHPGMTIRFEDGAAWVTVPFTAEGAEYLLRLVDADGGIVWIGQRTGGGYLTFEKIPLPAPQTAASYTFLLTGSAEGFSPITALIRWTPDSPVEPDPGCPRDASCPLGRFTDLDPAAWYHDGIHRALEDGIMNGLGDGTFRPNAVTSRAMLVTMLWRMAGEPRVRYDAGFTDVAENAWYAGAVRWAASSGIVSGYDAVTFGPDDGVTQEQLALILWRYAGMPADAGPDPLSRFGDGGRVSPWAADAMRWAVSSGIFGGGGDGLLRPGDRASRAEVAAVLTRFER